MEIVYQETKNGERRLELWDADGKVCTMTDVADVRKIEAIAKVVSVFENAGDEIGIVRDRMNGVGSDAARNGRTA